MVDGWPGRPARTHGHASDSSSAAAAHAAQGADGIGMNAASYVLYMPLGDQTYHSVMSTYAFLRSACAAASGAPSVLPSAGLCCSTDAGPSSNGEPFNNEVNNEGPDQQQSAWLAITTAAAAAGGSSDRKKWHLDSQHRPALDLESTRDCWVRAHNHWSTAVLFEHAFTGPGNLNKIK